MIGPHFSRLPWRELIVPLGIITVLLMGVAAPALADPAEPTNYESTVLDVQPRTDAASFEIVGGDAFVSVKVSQGHELLVPGYFGESYIWITSDGSVFVNRNSRAIYLNEDRYASAPIPDRLSEGAEPDWEQVGSKGQYAWHDHRTHWMSADLPPTVSSSERATIFPWQFPVLIDGAEALVHGELVWLPSRSALPAAMAGSLALLPLILGARFRAKGMRWLAFLAASAALTVALAEWINTPSAARGAPFQAALPIVALIAFSAPVWIGEPAVWLSRAVALAGWFFLAVWGVTAIDRLWLPVLVSLIPPTLERAAISFTLWASIAGFAAHFLLPVSSTKA